jgi:ribosomal protein S18 acetylase RimI-like enzyme
MVWRAESHETETVARLLIAFRDWAGSASPDDASFHASVGRLIDSPDTEFLLGAADRDAEAAGVCQLRYRFSVWTAAEDCWLEDLYVEDSMRSAGLGRAIVNEACEHARRRGCRRIELDVNEQNRRAIALYEGAGFSAMSKRTAGMDGRNLFLGLRLGD